MYVLSCPLNPIKHFEIRVLVHLMKEEGEAALALENPVAQFCKYRSSQGKNTAFQLVLCK